MANRDLKAQDVVLGQAGRRRDVPEEPQFAIDGRRGHLDASKSFLGMARDEHG